MEFLVTLDNVTDALYSEKLDKLRLVFELELRGQSALETWKKLQEQFRSDGRQQVILRDPAAGHKYLAIDDVTKKGD